jgi:hypothetical protein
MEADKMSPMRKMPSRRCQRVQRIARSLLNLCLPPGRRYCFNAIYQRIVEMDSEYVSVSLENLDQPFVLEPFSVNPASLSRRASQLPLLVSQENPFRSSNATEEQIEGTMKAWTPLMLRRWVLALFAGVSVALIITLEVILKVSTDRQGLGPINPSLYYLWTYGPTPALTIISAFWTQVDYRSRLMQPWRELAKRPQKVENTLLLDYISPDPVTIIIKSVRKGHWHVTAGLIGSLLLKLLMVISTGLFFVQSSSPPEHRSLTMTQPFDITGFNSSAVDDVAALIYAGVQFNNITYPPGTNASFVVETFNLTKKSTGKSWLPFF